jgi:SAM-dependent methyltransferase
MESEHERLLANAHNVERVEEWLWRSASIAPVSYPETGSAMCASLEEASFWFEHRNRCILHIVRTCPPPGVLLDVGGGNGAVTRHLEKNGFAALLLEPGNAAVATARSRGLSPILQSTFEGAGFAAETVPAIGLFDTLEHVERDRDLLRLAREVLVPGGRIYLTVPAVSWLWSAEDEHAGHHRRYSLRDLSMRLDTAGFNVERATYIFGPLVFPVLAARTTPSWLGLRSGGAPAAARREHGLGGGITSSLLRYSLQRELRKLRRSDSIRFGTSCLMVAVKPR